MKQAIAFERLLEELRKIGIADEKLNPLRDLVAYAEAEKPLIARLGMSLESAMKLHELNVQFMISAATVDLVKRETGKKVAIFLGSARKSVRSKAYKRVKKLASKFGPGWIIIEGGGPGIMEAACIGARLGGSLTLGLCLAADNVFEKEHNLIHDVHLYHADFYSRLFAFIEFADACIIDEGGLGTLQEKSWIEGCIQCGTHKAIPIFVLSKRFWKSNKNHFKMLVKKGLCDEKNADMVRFVDDGEEGSILERIDAYYARPPVIIELPVATPAKTPRERTRTTRAKEAA
jgi:predicted Rossmann-fold nucleotide-binding protein